jgi:hypothetical protein
MGTANPTAGYRSGSLDGSLWDVSRWSNINNPGQHEYNAWAASTQNQCGTSVQVAPDHDVNSCSGETVESVNDAANQSVLAMYPRQPFNFAGRTGVIEFDVSDNSLDAHGAWPTLAITDQPAPTPYGDMLSGAPVNARNSIGINFAGHQSGAGATPCVSVSSIWATSNYQPIGEPFNSDGCVAVSSSPTSLNHVEVQVSPTSLKVYMSNPGNPASTKLVADASFTLPLTQGLVWLEDVHYNGDKYCPAVEGEATQYGLSVCEQTDTFGWANLAFDGPVLPRDLGFDVADNNTPAGTAPSGQPMTNLAYPTPASLTLTNVHRVENATGAIITLNDSATGHETLTYTVNGHANTFDNSSTFNTSANSPSQSIALPVPLSELTDGTNSITISSTDGGVAFGNVDLVLLGAGGTVGPA